MNKLIGYNREEGLVRGHNFINSKALIMKNYDGLLYGLDMEDLV